MDRAQTSVRACWGYGLQTLLLRLVELIWDIRPKRVKAPYTKAKEGQQDPKYRKTRGTLWEDGGTTPQG